MDIMDAFSFEDKVEIKLSDFCKRDGNRQERLREGCS